jgi:hypothetical protein
MTSTLVKTVLLRLYGSMSINGLTVAFRKLKRLSVAERSITTFSSKTKYYKRSQASAAV